jgi:hypothetical protein
VSLAHTGDPLASEEDRVIEAVRVPLRAAPWEEPH